MTKGHRNVQRISTWNEAEAVSKAQGPETILRGLRLTITRRGKRGEQPGRHGDTVRYAYYSGTDSNGKEGLFKWNGTDGPDGNPVALQIGGRVVIWESVWRASKNMLSVGFGVSVGGRPGGLVIEEGGGAEPGPTPTPEPDPDTDSDASDMTLEEQVESLLGRVQAVERKLGRVGEVLA